MWRKGRSRDITHVTQSLPTRQQVAKPAKQPADPPLRSRAVPQDDSCPSVPSLFLRAMGRVVQSGPPRDAVPAGVFLPGAEGAERTVELQGGPVAQQGGGLRAGLVQTAPCRGKVMHDAKLTSGVNAYSQLCMQTTDTLQAVVLV